MKQQKLRFFLTFDGLVNVSDVGLQNLVEQFPYNQFSLEVNMSAKVNEEILSLKHHTSVICEYDDTPGTIKCEQHHNAKVFEPNELVELLGVWKSREDEVIKYKPKITMSDEGYPDTWTDPDLYSGEGWCSSLDLVDKGKTLTIFVEFDQLSRVDSVKLRKANYEYSGKIKQMMIYQEKNNGDW